MDRRRLALLAASSLAAAFSLSLPHPATASLVLALDLGELTARADRVIVAEVLSVKSSWDRRHKRIYSTIEVSVAETWKGEVAPRARLTIVQPGGSVGEIEMRVHGVPTFTVGERSVLFLRGAAVGEVVGLGQGRRPLRFDAAARRWMVEGGDRSAAVVLDTGGRMQPAGPEQTLPLDELRRRVRALVRP
jgi:hypothetical protein